MSQSKVERDSQTSPTSNSISKRARTQVRAGVDGRELSDADLATVSGGKDIEPYKGPWTFGQK